MSKLFSMPIENITDVYIAGVIIGGHTYIKLVPDWWTGEKLPQLVWTALAWPIELINQLTK